MELNNIDLYYYPGSHKSAPIICIPLQICSTPAPSKSKNVVKCCIFQLVGNEHSNSVHSYTRCILCGIEEIKGYPHITMGRMISIFKRIGASYKYISMTMKLLSLRDLYVDVGQCFHQSAISILNTEMYCELVGMVGNDFAEHLDDKLIKQKVLRAMNVICPECVNMYRVERMPTTFVLM